MAFCAPDERPYLKDIEKLTRQQIATVALPEGFMAAVAAIKRLKPAPKQTDSRERQPHGGRRFVATAEMKPRGEQRRNAPRDGRAPQQRDSGPRANPLHDGAAQPVRHPQRAEGHPAHRPDGAQARPFRGRRRRPGGGARASA